MTTLTKIEDRLSGEALYTWEANPKATSYDASWQRRSGTYTVLGMDYGVNPFGSYAAPIQTKKLVWKFRVVVALDTNRLKNLDLAADAVTRACARHREHLLCQSAAGAERVATGFVVDLQDVTTAADNFRHRDFQITWELNGPWQDRIAHGPHHIGDTVGVLMGGAPSLVMGAGAVPITGNVQPFTIFADGTGGTPAPNISDTGPIFVIVGPFGGTTGFLLVNSASGALLLDDKGQLANTTIAFTAPLGAGETLTIDCGALSITDATGADRWANLVVPDYQPWWQVIIAGQANTFTLVGQGTGQTFGAASQITTEWKGLY